MQRSLFAAAIAAAIILSVFPVPAHAADSRDGKNRWVKIYNDSERETVTSIRIRAAERGPARTTDPDIIPHATLRPKGWNIRVRIDDGRGSCVYNIRLRTNSPDRADWQIYNFNSCTQTTLRVR